MSKVNPTALQQIQWAIEKLEVETALAVERINLDGDDDVFEYRLKTASGMDVIIFAFEVTSEKEIDIHFGLVNPPMFIQRCGGILRMEMVKNGVTVKPIND